MQRTWSGRWIRSSGARGMEAGDMAEYSDVVQEQLQSPTVRAGYDKMLETYGIDPAWQALPHAMTPSEETLPDIEAWRERHG